MTYSEYEKAKRRLIFKVERKLNRALSAAEKRFLKSVINTIDNNFDTEDGVIKNNQANDINKFDRDWNRFKRDELIPIVKEMVADLRNIHKLSVNYYGSVFTKKRINEVRGGVFKASALRLGLDEKGNVIRDSYIDNLLNDTEVLTEIKRAALRHVTTTTLKKSDLKTYVRDLLGERNAVQRHFNTFVNDTYAAFDAETGNNFAVALDLDFGVYAGGVIKETRPFCRFRNRKVFTREQILKFGSGADNYRTYATGSETDKDGKPIKAGGYTNASKGEFQGKSSPYDPIVDRGGHNCRHTINWVTERQARRLGWKG